MPSFVVTGASRGLGLEFCKQLLDRGNTVFALARNPDASKGLKAISDPNLHVVKADITDIDSLEDAASKVAEITGGSLDVLINNAAYQDYATAFLDIDKFPDTRTLGKAFNENWNTNVLGAILTTDVFLPLLKKGTMKRVMTLSSGFGDHDFNLASGITYQAAYCTSKAALQMAMAKFALALKDEGFIIFTISPGFVNTAEGPPPAEAMPFIMNMMEAFKKVYPSWDMRPTEPSESVSLMLKVFDTFKKEDIGKHVSQFGNQEWL